MIYYNQQNKILPDSCVSVYGQNMLAPLTGHCTSFAKHSRSNIIFCRNLQCTVVFFFFFFFFIEPGCNYHSPSLIFKLITVLLMKTHFYYSFHCYVFFFLVQHIQCVLPMLSMDCKTVPIITTLFISILYELVRYMEHQMTIPAIYEIRNLEFMKFWIENWC